MTGSSFPERARSVKSRVYLFKASRWPSDSAESTFWPPRTCSMAVSKALRLRPWPRTASANSLLLSARAKKNSSLATNWSDRFMASFSQACSKETKSRPTCTCSCPCTWGSFFIAASATANNPAIGKPARCNKALGPSGCCSIAVSTWAGSM